MNIRQIINLVESAQRIDEITLPDSLDQAYQVLTNAGYEYMGGGDYSGVFKKPGANYVLKFFSAEDDAYLAFIDLVQHNPSPHFPKFYGKLVPVTDRFYAIRMEILRPADGSFARQIQNYIDPDDEDEYQDALEYMTDDLRHACDLVRELADSGYELDLMTKNIMLRGSTPVIIDPVGTIGYGS
jgi:hypothetical protein